MLTGFWCRSLNETVCLEDLGADWGDNIKWILWKWNVRVGLNSSVLGWGQVVGYRELDTEPSGSIKCREFLG